jgi:hypothetical protein
MDEIASVKERDGDEGGDCWMRLKSGREAQGK